MITQLLLHHFFKKFAARSVKKQQIKLLGADGAG